jgi:hypothetical protein
MGLKILLRSWKNRERLIKADSPDGPDLSKNAVDRDKPANDNDEVWPLIPFPDGWYGA